VQRPVVAVLMPRRAISAGRLEKRLIVIEPHGWNAEKLRGDRGKFASENNLARGVAQTPDVGHLSTQFRVIVDAPLRMVNTCHNRLDHRPEFCDLLGCGNSANQCMPVASKIFNVDFHVSHSSLPLKETTSASAFASSNSAAAEIGGSL